jgi:DNA-binding MarR family transcriptional regulator
MAPPAASSSSSAPPALEEVMQGLRRVMVAMRGRFSQQLAQSGLTWPQWMVLKAIARDGRRTVRELADVLQVTPANITGIVDRMERDGLVTRSRSSEDRRVVYVRLTERGHEKTAEVKGCANAVLTGMFDGWSDADVAAFRRLLEQVRLRPEDQVEF